MPALRRPGFRVSVARCRLAAGLVGLAACACDSPPQDARQAEIASVFTRAEQHFLRSRPQLMEGKYDQMRRSLYNFYRGNVPLYRHDWTEKSSSLPVSDYHLTSPLVLSTGDAHPENFGLLLAGDGTLALEPNDFDSVDRMPYLWDVRRLCIGMVITTRVANEGDEPQRAAAIAAQRQIARAAALGYVDAVRDIARSGERPRKTDGEAGVIADLFRRGNNDLASRDELAELTEVEGERRRLVRGAIDPSEPWEQLADAPRSVWDALPETLKRYRETLIDPPSPEFFTVLDVARQFGSGVASWPRVRFLVLVTGPSPELEDDVLLELKELSDSGLAAWDVQDVHFDSVQQRVLGGSRAIWAVRDGEALWGTSELLGLPVQVRLESEAQKTLRTDRMEDEFGTVEQLELVARELGGVLARVHSAPVPEDPNPAIAIATRIGGARDGFADEQADLAVEYGEQYVADWERFKRALIDLGPLLGLRPDPGDAPGPDLGRLIGTPPPVVEDEQ